MPIDPKTADLMITDFGAWENTLDEAQRQSLENTFRFEPDRVAAQKRFASVANVAAYTGQDVEEVSSRFEDYYMHAFARDEERGLALAGGVKDANEFYGLLTERAKNNTIKAETLKSASSAAFDSALRGGSDMADFAAWQVENEHLPEAFGEARKVWAKTRADVEKELGPDGRAAASRAFRAMRSITGASQESDAWINEAKSDLINLRVRSPKAYKLALAAVQLMAADSGKVEKGVVQGMGENAGRVISDLGASFLFARPIVEMSQDASEALVKAGITNAENPEQLAAQIRARREVENDIRDMSRGVIDPVKSEREGWTGWAESAAYMGATSLPYMVSVMIPGGISAAAGTFTSDSYNEFRSNGWEGAGAAAAAVTSGVLQAAVERASEAITKIPGVAGVLNKFGVKPGSLWVTQFFLRSGMRSGVEAGEEVIQEATTPFLQELAHAIAPSIPDTPEGKHLSDVMGRFFEADNFVPLLLSVIPLGMIGAGMSTSRDMDVMEEARHFFGDKVAADIMAEPDTAKRDAMIQEKFRAMPAEEFVKKARTRMGAVTEDAKRAADLLQMAETYGLIPRVRRDSEGWAVEDAITGAIARVSSRQEAVKLVFGHLDEQEQRRAQAGAQLWDELYEKGGMGDEVLRAESASMDTQKLAARSPEDAARVARAIETYAQLHGIPLDEARKIVFTVNGFNRDEQIENVRTAVSNVFGRGMNVGTVLHEATHGRWRAALESRRLTHDQGVAWVRLAENATGIDFLPSKDDAKISEDMLDEAIVDVTVSDAIGRRKDGSRFSAGLISRGMAAIARGERNATLGKDTDSRKASRAAGTFATWLKAWKEFWGQVITKGKALRNAKAEGKLGDDYDAFLDELMQASPQRRHEAAAAKEAMEIAQAGNMPFSLGYLGNVQDSGNVQLKSVDLARGTHESEGLDQGSEGMGTFRYRKDNETVYWHLPPGELRKESAAAALERKGFNVKRHIVMVYGSESALLAHGLAREVARSAFSLTPQDTEYLAAVEAGDMAKAQRMADEAANDADLEEWFHGNTKSFGGFSSTDLGVHLGTEESAQDRLDQTGQTSGVVSRYYVDIKNPVKLQYDPDTWQALDVWSALPKDIKNKVEDSYQYVIQDLELGELKTELKKLGFDGIKYPNAFEGIGDSILVFEDSQIKSADPVVYANGNVIPLSQRFNTESNDIRFSLAPRSLPEVQSPPTYWDLFNNDGESIFTVNGTPYQADVFRNALDDVGIDKAWELSIENIRTGYGEQENKFGITGTMGTSGARQFLREAEKRAFAIAKSMPQMGALDVLISRSKEATRSRLYQRIFTKMADVFPGTYATLEKGRESAFVYVKPKTWEDRDGILQTLQKQGFQILPPTGASFSLAPRSLPKERDAEYLAAVESGDLAKAQAMVDEAAKVAGGIAIKKLKERSDLFWRVHGPEFNRGGSPFAVENASSSTLDGEETLPGYSSFESAGELVDYWNGNNFAGRTLSDDNVQVVAFTGQKESKKGADGEPLATPDMQEVYRMTFGALVRGDGYSVNGKSADPVIRDESGQVIPLSQRFNPESNDIRFSLAPRYLPEVADTILAEQMKKPAFFEAFVTLARRKMDKLRKDGDWRVDKRGIASRKVGFDTRMAGIRSPANIEAERKFRLRSRQRELIKQGMNALSPETLAAYDQGLTTLEDQPLISAMLNDHGKLMSKTTAEKLGKLKTDGKGNAGDFDDAPRLPIAWYSKGSGIMPDVMAENLGFDSVPAFWDALRSAIYSGKTANDAFKKARDAVRKVEADALAQARKESDQWAKDETAKIPTEKDRQMMALRTLDVILSAFDPIIRAKVGGFVKLAEHTTDAAREKEITRRLAKLEEVIEEEAKKHYAEKIGKMLDKAAPVGKPGEIKKSKFIVTVQDELDAISEMVGMDGDDVADSISKNEAAIISAQTPEAADAALTELNLLEIFGGVLDVKRTTSFELEVASEYLEELMKQGRDARKMLDEARRERVKELVNTAKSEAFKGDAGPETTQAAKAAAAKKSGKAMLKKFFNELSGFDGVLRDVFGAGSKTAREFSERFTLNSNNYEDVQNERRKRLRDFARELYSTKLGAKINQKLIALERIENNSGVTYLKGREVKAHKLTLDAAAKIVADPKAFGFTAKDATAIEEEMDALVASKGRRNTFTYEQVTSDGDRTELPLSQMDALYISMALRQPGILEQQQRYGYDQETVDQLEKFLTDESKSWREWMQGEYDAEYQRANEVYMRMFNARMPKLMFYAPLLKNHQGQQAILDPLNTGISSNSANPGSIKSRKARTSSLRIDSALSVFWSHFNQMEYWISNAEYLRDVQSVMLNPEVRQSVVSAHGEDGMATVSAWVQLQMSRGVGKAALATAGSKMFRNVKSAISMKALALNLSTTLKTIPSVFYSLGEIHMSKWPAALASGMKHWDRLWKTNIIQRRLDIGGMPELRDLGNSALPMSWVNQGIRYGSYPTMYADGVFTTYSAAMAYGTSFDEAKRQGASDEVAHKYAEERTALIVSKTAQPENWTQKSLFENDLSGAGSLFFMFTSDPRQKAALTGEALNRWRKGSATREEAMRKFLAYWVIPGIMFQLANAIGRSLFKGDDDEWEVVDFATAALAGQLQGLALIGSAAEMLFSAAIAAAAEMITGEEVKRKPFWNSPKNPLDGAANDLIKSVEKITEDDAKDGLGKAWEIAKSAGMLLSPLSPAGAIPSTAERVMKDTTNLFYGADEE